MAAHRNSSTSAMKDTLNLKLLFQELGKKSNAPAPNAESQPRTGALLRVLRPEVSCSLASPYPFKK